MFKINEVIFDATALKFRCVQAYLHQTLKKAEAEEKKGIGVVCVRDTSLVKENLIKICTIIEQEKNTFEDIEKASKLCPFLIPYYNSISKIVKKHFVEKSNWVPGFLALETLRLFASIGYKTFEEIDFLSLQAEYQYADKEIVKDSNLKIHYQCAEDIIVSINKVRAVRKTKRPCKRKAKTINTNVV
jgi:hypothetical protein